MSSNSSQTRLCMVCSNFRLELASLIFAYESRSGYKHHASYSDLRAAALDGCELCFLLHWSCLRHGLAGMMKAEPLRADNWSVENFAQYLRTLDADLDSPFYIYLTVTILTTANVDERFEAVNGISYSRDPEEPTGGDAWLSLSALDGLNDKIIGRQLQTTWNVDLCRQWLKSCSEQHQYCRISRTPQLPTRVLRIDGDSSDGSVTLVETGGMVGHYVTLSYCWGPSKPPSTTMDNLEAHRKGVLIQSFPRLYRDALKVTQALGFHYLWIDSLCIIQDSESDWQIECSQMDNIYENSDLTINCPGAADTNCSFFTDRTTTVPDRCNLEICRPGVGYIGNVQIGLAHDAHLSFPREETGAPLDGRSWVVQEYVLSRRVLSFGSMQMYFACNEGLHFENIAHSTTQVLRRDTIGPQLEPVIPKDLLKLDTEHMHRLWYTTIAQYTKKALTLGKDNLPALSGLARRFGRRLEDDVYVAGLWRSDILHGLSWSVVRPKLLMPRYIRHPSITPPTWTWASTNLPVQFSKQYYSEPDAQFLAEISGVQCRPVGHDTFGEVESGKLEMCANVQPVSSTDPIHKPSIGYQPAIRTADDSIRLPVSLDRRTMSIRSERRHYDRSTNLPPFDNLPEGDLFLVALWYEDTSHYLKYFGLILQKADLGEPYYRRIGCVDEDRLSRDLASSLGCFTKPEDYITII